MPPLRASPGLPPLGEAQRCAALQVREPRGIGRTDLVYDLANRKNCTPKYVTAARAMEMGPAAN